MPRRSSPSGPCRPGTGAGGSCSPSTRNAASGTMSAGRDGSSGVAISRSDAITWSPAAGSSPHRSRASARSASSIESPVEERDLLGQIALARGDVARDLVLQLLLAVPGRERRLLERLELVALGRPG